MTKRNEKKWSIVTNIVTNVVTPILTIVSLVIAIAAMMYAHDSAQYGASVEKQQHEIDTLGIVITQLTSLDSAQQITNKSLKDNLDSQSRQISELKQLNSVASDQSNIAKTSLSLVVDDKIRTNNLDSKALIFGINKVYYGLNDLYVYVNPPYNGSEPTGEDFKAKLDAVKNQVISLTSNRYAWSLQYEYNNLMSLINLMDLTHLQFQHYGQGYPLIDFTIEKNFLKLFNYWNYLAKNDSISSRLFSNGMDSVFQAMAHNADSVSKSIK